METKSLLAVSSTIIAMAVSAFQAASIDEDDVRRPDNSSIFAQPRLLQQVIPVAKQLDEAFKAKDYKLAEKLSDQAVRLQPISPVMFYHRARVMAIQGRPLAAIRDLRTSIDNGLRTNEISKQVDFISLRERPEWEGIIAAARAPKPRGRTIVPGKIVNGIAEVAEENTSQIGADQFVVAFESPRPSDLKTIVLGDDSVAKLLNNWAAEGTAMGLSRVLYDNHDRLHSDMNWRRFPELTRVKYCAAAKAENVDNAIQVTLQYNWTTFGNSSTAVVGNSFWRSQPRLAYANPNAAAVLARQYNSNHLYLYPEHKDYDSGRNGRGGFGDVYPANTPYVLTSQGSSYSDKPFMTAVASTIAAFRPEVFQRLEQNDMVFPCVQMILRRCLKPIVTDADYLTGTAHPPVFNGTQLDVERMVKLAHQIEAANVPPMCRLKVVADDAGQVGVDYFEVQPREVLFDTDGAIARIYRSVEKSKTIRVTGTGTDVNFRPLTWKWAVLQGDPDLISITPLNDDSSQVEITIQYHSRRPVSAGSAMETNRVDIAAFVHNGDYFSAPAFVTWYFPDNEERDYDPQGRIRSVKYTDFAKGGNYVDPMLVSAREWTDEYKYSTDGRMTGWIRRHNGESRWFTARGEIVLSTDVKGRPATGSAVRYQISPRPKKPPILNYETTARVLTFEYSSDADNVGRIAN